MTSFFTDLEDQLRTAAREQTTAGHAPGEPPRRPRRGWRWLAGGARLVPVVSAVAITLAVVAGAVMLLGHRGAHPPAAPASSTQESAFANIVLHTPTARLHREFALIAAATRKVLGSSACHVNTTGPAKLIHAAPGRALLATLGLLRRPATAADRLPARALDVPAPGISVYAGSARRALTGAGPATFIVPVRVSPRANMPSDRCFALQAAAIQKSLPSFPRVLRAPTMTLATASLAYARTLAGHAPSDAICEVTVMGNQSLSAGCGMTAAQIRSGMLPDQNNGTFSGLVPDGVASVTLHFAGANGHPARSVTVHVHDNAYTVHVPGPPQRLPFPTVAWRAARGRVIKTFSQPAKANPQLLKQVCAHHPEACLPLTLASQAKAVHSTGSLAAPTVAASPAGAPNNGG